jgi:hypothetical protein
MVKILPSLRRHNPDQVLRVCLAASQLSHPLVSGGSLAVFAYICNSMIGKTFHTVLANLKE